MTKYTPPRIRVRDSVAVAALSALAAALVAMPSSADTVAWWHFDEKAPGEEYDTSSATASMSSTKVIDSCGNAPDGELLVVGGTTTGK